MFSDVRNPSMDTKGQRRLQGGQNDMKWDLTRQKVEGIAAAGGCPPPAQNVPRLASQYQEKK